MKNQNYLERIIAILARPYTIQNRRFIFAYGLFLSLCFTVFYVLVVMSLEGGSTRAGRGGAGFFLFGGPFVIYIPLGRSFSLLYRKFFIGLRDSNILQWFGFIWLSIGALLTLWTMIFFPNLEPFGFHISAGIVWIFLAVLMTLGWGFFFTHDLEIKDKIKPPKNGA